MQGQEASQMSTERWKCRQGPLPPPCLVRYVVLRTIWAWRHKPREAIQCSRDVSTALPPPHPHCHTQPCHIPVPHPQGQVAQGSLALEEVMPALCSWQDPVCSQASCTARHCPSDNFSPKGLGIRDTQTGSHLRLGVPEPLWARGAGPGSKLALVKDWLLLMNRPKLNLP